MARVAITQNFNDTINHPLPASGNPVPATGNPVPATGAEINAGLVTDADFDGSTTEKDYGAASGTEARFLQRRLLGLC